MEMTENSHRMKREPTSLINATDFWLCKLGAQTSIVGFHFHRCLNELGAEIIVTDTSQYPVTLSNSLSLDIETSE